ncbi:MAG: RagB/SusD family nutrient uptake outer membrane protein [Bacteroidales bacterium]|nr:RagB/SusD family nutrient uptake outer membrane protein [Bacteroidales bacterium]
MKKNIFTLLALGALLATACDFDEEPQSSASVDMVFSSEGGLKTYAYSFYNVLPTNNDAAHRSATLDYGAKQSISGMEVGAYTVNSSNSWSWTALRNINFFLENNTNDKVPEAVRNNYNGIARLFRARFYFDKLVTYGPVPWIDKVFNSPEDEDLKKGQDSRDFIIEKIIEDLDYAYNNITVVSTANAAMVTKWVAPAFKSRVCLFEAAWRKYHATDELDIARTGCTKYSANDLYNLAAAAAKEVMDKGPFKLHGGAAYKGGGTGAYRDLFTSIDTQTDEVIFAIVADAAIDLGEQNWWWNSSTYGPHLCMSRKFAKTYLNIDGTPYNEFNEDGTYKTFDVETKNRDYRMNQTIRAYDYTRKLATGAIVLTPANFQGHSLTGYQVTKFVMDDVTYDDAATNDNNTPLLRYAEVLLNYAEAKAELGQLTDADWAATVGALRSRAGITGGTDETGTLTTLPKKAEPYIASYYPKMASNPALLEVMREREIELAFEGFRLNDLKRWGICDLWVSDPWEGIFIPAINSPVDLNGDGVADAYFYDTDSIGDTSYASIGVYVGKNKSNYLNVKPVEGGYMIYFSIPGRDWPQRQYLYPIPSNVLTLFDDDQLTQNPGW